MGYKQKAEHESEQYKPDGEILHIRTKNTMTT